MTQAEAVRQIPPPPDGIWSMAYIIKLVDQGIVKTEILYPEDTVPIDWNGVQIFVTRGNPIEVPEFHAEVYRNSRQGTSKALEMAKATLDRRSFGPGQTTLEQGWNGVDADHPL